MAGFPGHLYLAGGHQESVNPSNRRGGIAWA